MRLLTITLVLLIALTVGAQVGNEGAVEGTVLDPSRAAIPGATITIRNLRTGGSFACMTNDEGLFRFLVLPTGEYEVTAERVGFAKAIHQGVKLMPGGRVFLNVQLQVGAQQESISVSDKPPLVELTRSAVSSGLDAQAIANLPVNGRNFVDFVVLTPGVVRGPGGLARFGGQNFGDGIQADG